MEQRYVREQFAYIRERVMERLVYPPFARRQGWSGEVRVGFIVQSDGAIEELRVVASSGRSLLDQQALRAVQAAAPFPPPPAPAMIVLPVLFAIATVHR
jgi:protein TonB